MLLPPETQVAPMEALRPKVCVPRESGRMCSISLGLSLRSRITSLPLWSQTCSGPSGEGTQTSPLKARVPAGHTGRRSCERGGSVVSFRKCNQSWLLVKQIPVWSPRRHALLLLLTRPVCAHEIKTDFFS